MNRRRRGLPAVEFDAFGVAVGASLVAGGLAIVLPFLLALTATLSALALAAWVAVARTRLPARAASGRWRGAVPLLLLGAGAVVFLLDPPPLARVRGLVLAVSLLPLWARERNPRPAAPGLVEEA